MARYGYTLFCEDTDPRDLIKQAVMAEAAGFDFLVISDHYHPWLPEHQHSAFAWTVLGAIAASTKTIELATMVTCPIIRYHPAIVAQMAATTAVIARDRFTLGLGAGERLNEHVVGSGWPSVTIRHRMLAEATEIIKLLWEGKYVNFKGEFYHVEDARVFDLPSRDIPMFIAAGGPEAARVAARFNAGLCVTNPEARIIHQFTDAGGRGSDIWGQIVLSWDDTESGGLDIAFREFRFSAGGWKVQAELPNPVNFDAAAAHLEPADLADAIPAGPDPNRHAKGLRAFLDAGVQHLAVVYPGRDTEGFMKFWTDSLRPKL